MDKVYLSVDQEPKSKNSISLEEKQFLRESIKNQLKKQNRRPFRGDIIFEIDFQTTEDNPPAIQTLTKNYLDLLHKEVPEVDDKKEILFKDDGQIKTLIADYHLNEFGNQTPQIRIRVYRYSHFIKDIELADRIRKDQFRESDSYSYHYRKFDDWEDEDRMDFNDNYYDDLRKLEKDKNWYDSKFGPDFYNLQKHYLQRRIQEQFLQRNNISIHDLISLHQSSFSSNKKYVDDEFFEKNMEIDS